MNVLIGFIDRLHRYNQQPPQPPLMSLSLFSRGCGSSFESSPQETEGVVVAPFNTANALSMPYIPRTLITSLVVGGSTSNIFNYPPTTFIISFINLNKPDLLQRPFILNVLFCTLSPIYVRYSCVTFDITIQTCSKSLSVVSEFRSRPHS